MFKVGHIAYFRKAKHSTSRKYPECTFKGHGVGVFMGHIPLGARDLSAKHIMPIFGEIGFVSFDDVGEFLGEEKAKEVIEKFELKYNGPKVDEKQPELPLEEGKIIELKKPPTLVGLNGKPLG